MTSRSPELTVIMANRNGSAFLKEAVECVLFQSFRSLELIVSDDGSSDDSLAVLSRISDPRLRITTSAKSTGPGAARNRALDAALGRWVAIVDADDLMHVNRFQTLLNCADASDARIVADNQQFFTGDRQLTGETLFPVVLDTVEIGTDTLLAWRFAGEVNRLGYLKPMVRADALADLRYRTDLRIGEDFDLLLRLSLAGHELTLIPQPLYYYRRRAGSASHRLKSEEAGAMIEAMCDLPLQSPAQSVAVKARIAALQNRFALEAVVEDIKAARFGQAALGVVRTPSVVRALGTIAKNKVFKEPKPKSKGRLPLLQAPFDAGRRPKVHIRVPTYKRPERLRRALVGLQVQTEKNWICDVYDDDPKGSSQQVVAKLNDARITYHTNSENLLASRNIDQCFTKSNPHNADYFCVLEDDNQLLPTHLEDNIRVIVSEDVQVVLRNQRVEHATGTKDAWLSEAGLLDEKFVEGTYDPEYFHLALMADMGVSNGGLFWSRNAISNLEIGEPVSATLQEYLRTFAIVEPIYVAMKPTAIWAENGENTTRDLGAATGWLRRELALKRSVQILQRRVWSNANKDVRKDFLIGSGFGYPAALRFAGLVKSHTRLSRGHELSRRRTLELAARGALIRVVGRPEPGFMEYLEKSGAEV